jgi:methylmalonyl-CoA mutase N-terminal domain/subunit
VTKSLASLRAAASGTSNLFPHVLACVESYATMGEICRTLEGVWGPWAPAAT